MLWMRSARRRTERATSLGEHGHTGRNRRLSVRSYDVGSRLVEAGRRTVVPDIAPRVPRVDKRADDPGELDDRARPAVGDDQRKVIGLGRSHVQEVDVLSVDGDELGELVEARFVFSPVVGGAPVLGQLPQVVERHSIVPADSGRLVGPVGPGQTLAQIIQIRLGHLDAGGGEPQSCATSTQQSSIVVIVLRPHRLQEWIGEAEGAGERQVVGGEGDGP